MEMQLHCILSKLGIKSFKFNSKNSSLFTKIMLKILWLCFFLWTHIHVRNRIGLQLFMPPQPYARRRLETKIVLIMQICGIVRPMMMQSKLTHLVTLYVSFIH